MKSIDLYLKVEADLGEGEETQKFARELCRVLQKVYGVRRAEITNVIDHSDHKKP